jgi:hypothetical protein
MKAAVGSVGLELLPDEGTKEDGGSAF